MKLTFTLICRKMRRQFALGVHNFSNFIIFAGDSTSDRAGHFGSFIQCERGSVTAVDVALFVTINVTSSVI